MGKISLPKEKYQLLSNSEILLALQEYMGFLCTLVGSCPLHVQVASHTAFINCQKILQVNDINKSLHNRRLNFVKALHKNDRQLCQFSLGQPFHTPSYYDVRNKPYSALSKVTPRYSQICSYLTIRSVLGKGSHLPTCDCMYLRDLQHYQS